MLTSGTFLGAYEVIDLLGAGGMGDVYRARDPRLGREVALKVLPAAFSTDADRVRRFEQEARAAAALTHPNILVVYDVGSHEQAPYIVSELLAGVTLQNSSTRRVTGWAIHRVSGPSDRGQPTDDDVDSGTRKPRAARSVSKSDSPRSGKPAGIGEAVAILPVAMLAQAQKPRP